MKVTKTYDERHAEIMEVSLRLFIQNGMKETTVNEIVKAVNIAKGTFYHYFESKDDLILMLRANYMRGFLALTADYITQCKSSDWHGKIHAWCMGSIQHYYEHKEEHDALFHQNHHVEDRQDRITIVRFLESLIIEGNEVKAWQVESPDLAALLIYHGMHLALDECKNDDLDSLKEIAERFYQLFIKILS